MLYDVTITTTREHTMKLHKYLAAAAITASLGAALITATPASADTRPAVTYMAGATATDPGAAVLTAGKLDQPAVFSAPIVQPYEWTYTVAMFMLGACPTLGANWTVTYVWTGGPDSVVVCYNTNTPNPDA